MIIRPNDLLALDTNALVHWVRKNATGRHLLQRYALEHRVERPLVSTIVEGELRGLAKCWNWGPERLQRLDGILAELVRVDAGLHDIVLAYAELYCEDQCHGHSTGENDLWIAATAKATGAILLTCDSDFLWMTPHALSVEIVPSIK